MWRRVILAATVGLVPVVAPAPASRGRATPVPAQMAPDQDCEQVMQQAQRAALATGKGGKVLCMSRVSSPEAAPDVTHDGGSRVRQSTPGSSAGTAPASPTDPRC